MSDTVVGPKTGARRADFSRAGSRETQRALVRAAISLWRVRGFADTTVADICRIAGVSKGLFYFYFARKEDVLNEVGVFSVERAQADARELMQGRYKLLDVIDKVIANLGQAMRRSPRDFVLEVILEGYRRKSESFVSRGGGSFGPAFEKAVADGKLPATADVARLAYMSQMVLSECTRAWAREALDLASFEIEARRQIRILLHGIQYEAEHLNQAP